MLPIVAEPRLLARHIHETVVHLAPLAHPYGRRSDRGQERIGAQRFEPPAV